MEGKQEEDADEQSWLNTFTGFVKNFVSGIMDCKSFLACDTEMKQRIKHFLFILNFLEEGNSKQLQIVLQDNKSLLDDIAGGSISWTSELYFKAWQQRVWRRFYRAKMESILQSKTNLDLNDYDAPTNVEHEQESLTNEKTIIEETPTNREKLLKCKFCASHFNSNEQLQKHEKNHENNLEKPFEKERETCQKCGKSVTDVGRHLKFVHSPPTSCPWCGFVTKDLRRHLRRTQCDLPEDQRTKRETTLCHICSKMIETKKIKVHLGKIHGTKKFQCDLCEYKSYSNHNLFLHIKRVHEKKPLKEICPECNKECVSLEWHIQTYHTSVSQ